MLFWTTGLSEIHTPQRTEVFEYPLEALRELVLNAIIHRQYDNTVDKTVDKTSEEKGQQQELQQESASPTMYIEALKQKQISGQLNKILSKLVDDELIE